MNDPPAPLARRLIGLAVPIAIGRLGIVGMGVVDTIVVGQIAPQDLAHQALGWTINGPALIGGIGLLLGVQVLSARAIGEGRPGAAGRIWRRGLLIAGAAGAAVGAFIWLLGAPTLALFGIAPRIAVPGAAVASVLALAIPPHLAFMASVKFLEALQRPTPGAIAMWVANGVNLALNLAFVPVWGAIGSAWATVCARLFLAGTIAGYIWWAPGIRPHLAWAESRVDEGYRALLKIGAAAALSGVVEAGAFAAMGVIAARVGGATAIATFTIATGGLVTLVFLLAQGFATAGLVLVSDSVGRGARTEADRAGWCAITLTLVAMTGCGIGCSIFPEGVARAFTSDAVIAASLVSVMGLVTLLMVPDGGQGAADSVLRARDVNWFPTIARFVAFVLIAPPLAFWLGEVKGGGLTGVVAALLIASSAAFLALMLRLALLGRHARSGT